MLFSTAACDKKLPPERQKILQEEANSRKIRRVTENQMVEYVQEKGEELLSIIEMSNQDNPEDEMQLVLGEEHTISYLLPQEASTGELNKVMEAYMYSVAESSGAGANLQILEDGNILYTIPNITDSSGIMVLKGIWKIEFLRKIMVNQISAED